jgi:hypothetical protein
MPADRAPAGRSSSPRRPADSAPRPTCSTASTPVPFTCAFGDALGGSCGDKQGAAVAACGPRRTQRDRPELLTPKKQPENPACTRCSTGIPHRVNGQPAGLACRTAPARIARACPGIPMQRTAITAEPRMTGARGRITAGAAAFSMAARYRLHPFSGSRHSGATQAACRRRPSDSGAQAAHDRRACHAPAHRLGVAPPAARQTGGCCAWNPRWR